MPKSVDVFNSSIQLSSNYNSIYFRTFHYALGKRSETEGDYDMRKLCDIEAFYRRIHVYNICMGKFIIR
jgi:hypothetical protein